MAFQNNFPATPQPTHPIKRRPQYQKLKPTVVKEGYSFVSLYKNGVKYNKRVHLLMKLAYGLKGQIVDHKNRNRSDNSLKNLRGASKSKNSQNRSKPNTSKYPYWKEIYGKNKK